MKNGDSEVQRYASLKNVLSERGRELRCPHNLTFSVMEKVHEAEQKSQCRHAFYEKIAVAVVCAFSLCTLIYILKDTFAGVSFDLFDSFSPGAVVPAFFIVTFFIVLKHFLQKRFGNI